MTLYCGIDLHSTNNYVAILNDKLERVAGQRLGNDLEEVLRMLSPYRGEIAGIAVESTFNWYWLVDGLMDAGYRLHLANTCKMKQYDGMKYKDDRHDARWLARLLALGILPVGHIYSREERPLRDLLRRRSFLVKKRSSMLISMRGAFECRTGMRAKGNDIKTWTEDDLEHLLSDPDVRLGLSCLLAPIKAMTEQIEIIEKWVLPRARLRDEFRMLETVWGIGKILGLTIMYEVGDISRRAGARIGAWKNQKPEWTRPGLFHRPNESRIATICGFVENERGKNKAISPWFVSHKTRRFDDDNPCYQGFQHEPFGV